MMPIELIKSVFSKTEMASINSGEGGVVSRGGKKIAVFKEKDGKLVMMSARCTHMGCTVHWNKKENTWDCPCHGSRFDKNGKVIHGPAEKNLIKE